ncbi:fatty-acyl-CoA synthase [Marinobacter segnicrescens]|uniref:Fatty-acyl-CoA synthase n=1 Tax=Marinobacter segnicrescens TaxID=430453 RepID=A0A1I0IC76_9GAMM|nr:MULTISPECIES: o-succinylbenzoate--CoA ligase [Marinobacter]SET94460.1 fatty-acyl-CoA synthase [Marinobacter segnicrescens]
MTQQQTQQTDPSLSSHYIGGIGDWLRYHAWHRPDTEAVVCNDDRVTYGEFDQRVNRAANMLAAHGATRGSRVCLLMLNSTAFLETFFACAKLGAIAVPLNFRLSAKELEFIINDAEASVIVYHARFLPLLEPIRNETTLQHAVAVNGECGEGMLGADGDPDYRESLAAADATDRNVLVGQDDPLMMMYTSGTTGKPKGALLTHANPTWVAINTQMSPLALNTSDSTLTVAPLFHIGGLAIYTLPVLYCGGRILLQAQFEPEKLLKMLEKERVSTLFLLPAMWLMLSQRPDFDDYDLSSLKVLLSGGAPCPIPVIEFFQKRGFQFLEGFGMTETCASACFLDNENAVRKNGSVGKPLIHVQMRIVDENDNDVAPGETGELVLRGPSMFREYWNRPDATAEEWRNGWFHSGDLARQDDEGFYYIVDRKKDMLISGGENVYPTQVEQVLYRHPKVRDVAVIGVPDDKWGEVPMALVVPEEGEEPTLEDIQTYCSEHLARFKVPKHLAVVEELPRTATGKVLKRELRKQYQ